jgi:RNA polymerase sigma factor (sigma-70 family)
MTASLDEFIHTGSQDAFREVMRAHADLVYTVALRQVRDHHLADDVTQAVFIILARKAPRLGVGVPLGGWLVKTTRLAARDALKIQNRRRHHETAAGASRSARLPEPADRRNDLALAIDEGIGRLSGGDRDVVVLRYYHGRSLREIASQLSISEEAAKKRVTRAVGRLKQILRPATADEFTSAFSLVSVSAAHGSVAGHAMGQTGKASELARQIATQVVRHATYKLVVAGSIAAVGLAAVATYSAQLLSSAPPPTVRPVPDLYQLPADARLQTSQIAPGWPVALPGSISGTPVIADLEQPGQHCVVVACMAQRTYVDATLAHPRPDPRPLVCALHADGSPVDGFPIALDPDVPRQGSVFWASHPSVVPADDSRKEGIVIVSPSGRIDLIRDGRLQQIGDHAGPGATVPVLSSSDDVSGDLFVPMGQSKALIWPAPKISAFAGSSVGHLYGNQWLGEVAAKDAPPQVIALSHLGGMLPGWPRPTLQSCAASPALGNLDNDPLMEICAVDRGGHVYLWHADGTPFVGTHSQGAVTGIFRNNIYSESTPTIADVDGDGRQDLVIFDTNSHSLFAWHGDGKGVTSSDGIVARLPQTRGWGGVCIVHLGDAGGTDFFVGTSWVHLGADHRVTVQPMLSESPATTTWCTVGDLFNTGTADILFGTADGRVYVYQTRQAFDPSRPSWPTANGGPQHTGVAH